MAQKEYFIAKTEQKEQNMLANQVGIEGAKTTDKRTNVLQTKKTTPLTTLETS